MDAGCFSFVLVRPKSAGNIGAAARALKNMGFDDLRIAAPARYDAKRAAVRAVHAADVLTPERVFPDLDSAIAQHTIVVGTTARTGQYREHAQPLHIAAKELTGVAETDRVALVFGPEDFGLSNDDLSRCHRLITIPAAPAYPSLNLAHAVMVTAYEIRMALQDREPPRVAIEDRAPASEVAAMYERLRIALVSIGFLPEENPEHIMTALRILFGRDGLRPREVDILNGIARQIRWFAEGGQTVLQAKAAAGVRLR